MSNRFHTKWHRRNHHTYGNSQNPDASFDPIASPAQPFLGDFSIQGGISAVAPASAYGVYIYTNNTALCAYAATRAGYFNSQGPMGVEIYDSKSRAISAYAPFIGLDVVSDTRAISAFGGVIGGEFYSPQYALSAYGGVFGASITSPVRAISAFGGSIGIEVGSPLIALSAYGNQIGAVISSNTVALSTGGGDNDPYPNSLAPYDGPAYISKNVLNNRTGIFTEDPLSAFHVTGGTLLDGHCTITGNLSVLRDFTYFDTYVYITSATQIILENNSSESPALLVSNTGENYVMQVFDGGGTTMSGASPSGYPALIVDGHSSRPGYVGLGTLLPNNPLTVVGTISGSKKIQIGYNATASGYYSSVLGGFNNTASGTESSVLGGYGNNASGCYSSVAGGINNTASGYRSFVGAGSGNNASASGSVILAGRKNTSSGSSSLVGTGTCNTANATDTSVLAGVCNIASNARSTVLNGCLNTASGSFSIIGNGNSNTASGAYSFVASGSANNTNNQANAFILGSNLTAPLSNYTYVNNISAAGYSRNQYSVVDSSFNGRTLTTGNDKTLMVQSNTTASGYASFQNLFNGVSASTDISIFNNNNAYVDLGINNTGYNGSLYSSAFTIASANDAYLFSNSSANNLVIGTANGADLVFFTGGTLSGVKVNGGNEALRIKSSGNVGIGTSAPSEALTIFGNISASGNITIGNSITSRYLSLIHGVPNDGVNPVLFIGERGDGTVGSINGLLSGFNTTYDEIANRYAIVTNFGDNTAFPAITALSISLSGNIYGPNNNTIIPKTIWSNSLLNTNPYVQNNSTTGITGPTDVLKVTLAPWTTYNIKLVLPITINTNARAINPLVNVKSSAAIPANFISILGTYGQSGASRTGRASRITSTPAGGNIFGTDLGPGVTNAYTNTSDAIVEMNGIIKTATQTDLTVILTLSSMNVNDSISIFQNSSLIAQDLY